MKIYLIRHTKPQVEKGICYGITDLDVAESFEQEAIAVKAQLPILTEQSIIFSSPLQRCYKLAQFIADKKAVQIESNLIEISFGDWELKPWRSLDRVMLLEWRKHFVEIPSPNGEAFRSVYNRVKILYENFLTLDADQIFVVSHSGVIRAFLCLLQDTPLHQAFDEQFGFGVVFEIENGAVRRVK